jgi:hypothetical protein
MKKIRYYRAGRIRVLKPGIDPKQYELNHPDAVKIDRVPCDKTLMGWANDGGCEAVDGCWTEPDGSCEHGLPSWMLALNMI